MKTLSSLALTLLLCFGLSHLAGATVLLSEDFSGADAVNLDGKTPTTLDASLSGATWTAPTSAGAPFDFERNGDIDANNNTTWVNIGAIINDAKETSGGVFTVSASFAGRPVSGSWFALGFYTSPIVTSGGNTNLEAGILFRDDGDLEGWSDVDNIVAADFAENITTETLSVELDLSDTAYDGMTTFGTITFRAGAIEATHNLDQDFSWSAVGFGTSTGVTGTIESFELTVVPEPSSFALLAGSLGVLLLLRRRRSPV